MLPLINLVWNPNTLAWDGGFKTLEEVVKAVITLPFELNTTEAASVNAIKKNPIYPAMFKKNFWHRRNKYGSNFKSNCTICQNINLVKFKI